MSAQQELMAYAGFAGRVQDAAERAGSLVELQDAIKAALIQLRDEQPSTDEPAGGQR
jgi:hypothetical protein